MRGMTTCRSVLAVVATIGFGLCSRLAVAADLFVASELSGNNGSICEFTPAGSQSTFASGLDNPTGLAFDGSGNLFEAELISGNIYKFTPSGSRSTFASGLSNPEGLAFDSSGDLFVAATES